MKSRACFSRMHAACFDRLCGCDCHDDETAQGTQWKNYQEHEREPGRFD